MFNQPKLKYLLLFWDLLLLSAAFVAAAIQSCPRLQIGAVPHCVPLLPFYALVIGVYSLAFLFCNLYKRNVVLTRYRQFMLILKAFIISGLITFFVFSVMRHLFYPEFRRMFTIWFTLYGLLLFLLARALVVKPLLLFLARRNLYRRNVLIVGPREASLKVARALDADLLTDFHVAGFIGDKNPELLQPGYLDGVVHEKQVDEVLIVKPHTTYEDLIRIAETCLATGKVVRIYSDFLEIIANKINVEYYGEIPVVMLNQQSLIGLQWRLKRLVDVVLASVGLMVLAPLFALIAAGIKLSSPGPVIFTQTRIGRNGQPFRFYKFRSMHVADNDATEHKKFVQDFIRQPKDTCARDDIKVFKITNDPRIFKLGKFIRKTSIDELPQLFNVLKGDMSLVGPRPCLPYEWECYEDWHKRRLDILPGCTGMWQALGRSTVSFEEMVILDLYYRSNMTLWLDLKIVLQTFPVIFLGKGGF
jgi:exopolysaccharide biosynthesis polyprenyl glycosylphosphotransferase